MARVGEAEAGRARSGGAHPTADKTFNGRRWQEVAGGTVSL